MKLKQITALLLASLLLASCASAGTSEVETTGAATDAETTINTAELTEME